MVWAVPSIIYAETRPAGETPFATHRVSQSPTPKVKTIKGHALLCRQATPRVWPQFTQEMPESRRGTACATPRVIQPPALKPDHHRPQGPYRRVSALPLEYFGHPTLKYPALLPLLKQRDIRVNVYIMKQHAIYKTGKRVNWPRTAEEGMPRSVLPLEYRRQAKKFLIWFR